MRRCALKQLRCQSPAMVLIPGKQELLRFGQRGGLLVAVHASCWTPDRAPLCIARRLTTCIDGAASRQVRGRGAASINPLVFLAVVAEIEMHRRFGRFELADSLFGRGALQLTLGLGALGDLDLGAVALQAGLGVVLLEACSGRVAG